MKRKAINIIIIIFFVCLGIFAGWQIYREYSEYHKGSTSYTELDQYVDLPDEEDTSQPEQSAQDTINWPEVNFEELSAINQDIVGWIYIEDTKINYPVVQGNDNQYYLKHLFNGQWNNAGCIFLDSRNTPDFSDRHSIIYGHHMKNDTMFSGLTEYKKQEFYDAHPTVLLVTPEQNIRIEVFAGYVANVKDDAWEIDLESDMKFEEWLADAKERSCFESGIAPAVTDRIVTLSTCSYEFDNARFVLLGVIR